jgi:hypothetical protein
MLVGIGRQPAASTRQRQPVFGLCALQIEILTEFEFVQLQRIALDAGAPIEPGGARTAAPVASDIASM